MATQAGGKGTQRSSDRKKQNRQQSYIRAQARNKRNEARNEARRQDNVSALAELGGKVKTKTYLDVRSGKVVTKNESPSEALARTKREANGWTHHIPKPA